MGGYIFTLFYLLDKRVLDASCCLLPEFCFGRKSPIFALQKPAKLAVTYCKASQKQIPAKAGRVWELTAIESGTSKNQYSTYISFCIVGLFLVSDFYVI